MSTVWAESSVRSETQRLNKLWDEIDGDPTRLWLAVQRLAPYTRQTYIARVGAFWDWLIENGHQPPPNPYKTWKKKNKRVFMGAYVKRPCKIPFDELMRQIDLVPEERYRNKMKQLLIGGLRVTESDTLKDGEVLGKGNKRRRVYVPELGPMVTKKQYSGLLRRCHKYLGVTPHKLRSARMTDMARRGLKMHDLMEFAGWASPGVAGSYIAANESLIKELAEQREKPQPIVEELKKQAVALSVVGKLLGWARVGALVK